MKIPHHPNMRQPVTFIRYATILLAASSLPATPCHAASVTFEAGQGYVAGDIRSSINGATTGAPFDGQQGWSRSTSTGNGQIISTLSSGDYIGGLALAANADRTYIGGKLGGIAYTGSNSIAFDARGKTGIQVGFLGDNGNHLFDQSADTGMSFGVGGAGTPRFEARYASFGAEIFNPAGAVGSFTEWFRYSILIGERVGGFRTVTMSLRNLSTASDVSLGGPGGNWTFTVTDTQFGVAPEDAVGIWVRASNSYLGGGYIDNLTFTAVPEPTAALLSSLSVLAILRRRRVVGGQTFIV